MSIFTSKKEKELMRKLKEEENELEENLDKEKVSFWDLLKELQDKEIETEYIEYLTESEKEELEGQKKTEKKIVITASSIFGIFIISIIFFLFLFNYHIESDLIKVVKPLIEKYYKENYKVEIKTEKINYICLKEEECSNITLLTTKDNKHIITLDNKEFGDDLENANITKQYQNAFQEQFSTLDILHMESILSYKDYYIHYNTNYEYINVLPRKELNDLLQTKKLTITDIIGYQGILNEEEIKKYLQNFSEDSKLYFIKYEKGLPTMISIITKQKSQTFTIQSTIEIQKDIHYYELDRSKNNVTKISINEIANNNVETLGDYTIKNATSITVEKGRDETIDKNNNYFFLGIDNSHFSKENLVQLNSAYNSIEELPIDEYKEFILFKNAGKTYLLGNDNISFGYRAKKETWLCKLGLC